MRVNKVFTKLKTEDNSRAEKILRKLSRVYNGEISCSICPVHKVENKKYKSQRSWKKYRKTQYKNKNVS